ncbi:ETEC_3214 domain-containing protein [Pseudomonas siliginis]|uniref:ETEC_3214 domain-containing protein n=1 Tax=Pseudomonas siliginis TaxID=2842346 RepID=UPI0038700298
MDLEQLFGALPDAATSPYAFVAYVLLVATSAAIAWRVKRNKNLLSTLEKIPVEQRAELVAREMGAPLPPGLTAEQWIEYKIHQYYLLSFLSVLICGTVIFAIAYSNPKPIPPKWDSTGALSDLKIGVAKEYVRTRLGIPPVSEGISDKLGLPEEAIYERYSGGGNELQIVYMKNKVVGYVLRSYGETGLHKIIRTGSPEWVVGKTKFTEAGDAPQYSNNELHWGQSLCRIEQYYYGKSGDYNTYYYALNKTGSDGELRDESSPNAVMVSGDICSLIKDEAGEQECNETLRGMACTSASDFEG